MNNLDFKLSEENFTVFNSEKLEDKNVIKFFKEKEMFDMKKKENEYYKEEVKTRNVLHIILANDDISNENNEAGKHFNKKSIDFSTGTGTRRRTIPMPISPPWTSLPMWIICSITASTLLTIR